MSSITKNTQRVYRLKLWLCGIEPLIWRRFDVPSGITLPKLHRVIQIAMGWEDYHLHQFKIGRRTYEVPDPEDLYGSKSFDERRVKLEALITEVGVEFGYLYDFGDGWQHKLLLEAIALMEPGVAYPKCLGGARNGPPEDAGGPFGYQEYLETLADPGHERYEELLAWRGPFDAESFDLDTINDALNRELGKIHSPKAR